VIGGTCFLLWGLLAAPGLRRDAETSPLGIRRTASLAVLAPLARISESLGLDRVQNAADEALGRRTSSPIEDLPIEATGPLPKPRVRLPRAKKGHPRPQPSASTSSIPGVVTAGSTPTSPAVSQPMRADRLRVLVIGDSIGEDLGIGLGRLLSDQGTFVTKVDARQSTGLARPDYFDWQAQLDRDIRSFRPDVVVAMFGANDNQGFIVGDTGYALGTSSWRAIYTHRIDRMMLRATTGGRPMIWVGMPPMKDGGFSTTMATLNDMYRAEAVLHPGVVYIDSWSLFAGSKGGYAPFLPNRSGQEEMVREPDGVHFTIAGDERLADAVFGVMRTLWQPPRPAPGPRPDVEPSSAVTPVTPAPSRLGG
jgi:hypothetical protein